MIRVGVIGLGFGKAIHIPALRLDPRVEIAAICGLNFEKAGVVARELGIPKAYESWRELLADKSIQAITIATPPHVQAEIVEAAIAAHKHLFCEKPLGARSQTALAWAREASTLGLANMVDFEFPELTTWQHAKAELSRLGSIKLVMANWQVQASGYREKNPTWKIEPGRGGGTLRYLACHSLYYLEWLLGPMTIVGGNVSKDGSLVRAHADLNHGGYVDLCVGGNTPNTNLHRVEIWGEKGRLLLENDTPDYMKGFVLSDPETETIIAQEPISQVDGRITAVGGVLRKFIDWVEKSEPQTPSFRDGARIEALMEEIERKK
ncbi:MAG: Gfo/Idh/MocA family oxidoreductase [Bdellovibrionia bacterium]